jgi:hypothetical protein
VVVGKIYKVKDLPIFPKKDKFGLCVSVTEKYFLVINSEDRAIYDCIPIPTKGDGSFPYKDSHIGCKNIFTVEPDQIVSKAVGELDDSMITALSTKILSSKFLTQVQITEITNPLSALKESLKSN